MPFTMPGFVAGSGLPPMPVIPPMPQTPAMPSSSAATAAATVAPTLPPLPSLQPGQTATASASNANTSSSQSGSTRAVVPSDWLGTAGSAMGELQHQWDHRGDAYDTSQYDRAAESQQARDLATGMASANNAADAYAAKTRQAGGSGAAAGLIKAQGQIAATDAAGKAKVEQAKYDVEQREAAASHAAQIATTLAGLRNNYLNMLLGRDTTGSQSGSQSGSQLGINDSGTPNAGGAGGAGNWYSLSPNGMGLASGMTPVQYNAFTGEQRGVTGG